MLQVGFFSTVGKLKKLKWDRFDKLTLQVQDDASDYSTAEIYRVDENEFASELVSIESKTGKRFDIVVAKLTDLISGQKTDELNLFLKYCETHPDTVVIDPYETQQILADRILLNEKFCKVESMMNLSYGKFHYLPIGTKTYSPTEMKNSFNELKFPLISKPEVACGVESSHLMKVHLTSNSLKSITEPCTIQNYINHDGVLYKAFAIGNLCFILKRDSLPNITMNSEIEDSENALFELDNTKSVLRQIEQWKEKKIKGVIIDTVKESETFETDNDFVALVSDLVKHTASVFNVTLFGLDLIIESRSGCSDERKVACIDINFFPSYNGMKPQEFFAKLISYVVKNKINRHV